MREWLRRQRWPFRQFRRWQAREHRGMCGDENPHSHGGVRNRCLRQAGHRRRHRDMWKEEWR